MAIFKFGDVIKDVKINVNRANNPYERYIAGNHMDSEDLTLRRWGNFATDDVGPAFIRLFRSGQVLYGSRRTYLKKVAVAHFDGITANTTFVFETKDNNILEQRLLPFLLLSERFTKFSIRKSKGSTNPYVLFSDLSDYEFELPSIRRQRILADKLWAAYDLKEAYKKMIAATDEMIKAQFIEMFGSPFEDKTNKVPLSNLCTINPPKPKQLDDALSVSFVPMDRIKEDGTHLDLDNRFVSEVKNGFTYCAENDVLFAKITPCMENGKGAIMQGLTNKIGFGSTEFHVLRPIEGVTTSTWLFYLTKLDLFRKDAAQNMTGTSGQKRVPASYLENFMVSPPSMVAQKKFIRIVKHADQSKFELRQAIESIDKIIKSLINN